MEVVNYIVLAITLLVLSAVTYFHFKRFSKMEKEIGNLITEAKKLNINVEIINNKLDRKAKKSGRIKVSKPICKNCTHRQTFLYPDSPNDFFYECKLNRDSIALTDTCNKFSLGDQHVAGSLGK